MARTVTYVSTDELRDWARENDWKDERGREVAERGRVSTKLVNDFNKANKRYFKQYSPITRRPMQPGDSQDQTPAPAPRASQPTTSRSTSNAKTDTDDKASTSQATTVSNEGVNSLQDVIAMLTAADKGGKGRPAVVTIQTLVRV